MTPLLKRRCMAHWQRHTGLFLEDACSRAGLVPASFSPGLHLILKQCSFTRFLCLTKVQKVFRWEFYFGPCKMCRHKELQKTRSFIPDLSEFFPCPPFQGHFSNTGPCIQQLEKPFTLHKNKDLLIFFSQQKESHSCEILSRSVGPGCWFSPCRHVETMNYLGVDHWTLIWIGRGA